MRKSLVGTVAVMLVVGMARYAVAKESREIGSEVPVVVPPLATQGPKPLPIEPKSAEQVQQAIVRGADFLLEKQLKNGAWGSPTRTKELNVYAPVPGAHHAFRTAVTALAISALIDSSEQFEGQRLEAVTKAIRRGQGWLLKYAGKLRRAEADALYNVWGHAFTIPALVSLHDRAGEDGQLQAQLKALVEYQVDRLARYSSINGGWGYYDFEVGTRRPSSSPSSFTTATALVALKDAERLGIELPEKILQQAIDSLLRQRLPDYAYLYGEYLEFYPRAGINRPGGSLGRSQACNLAMRLHHDKTVTDEVLKTWLNRLFARNGWLSIGRKRPVPHESYLGVAGYFYYYGHYYAAMCIDQLPETERPYFQDHLVYILLPLQEKDGSWWDFPLYDYHQQYGTAMTVSALVRCQKK